LEGLRLRRVPTAHSRRLNAGVRFHMLGRVIVVSALAAFAVPAPACTMIFDAPLNPATLPASLDASLRTALQARRMSGDLRIAAETDDTGSWFATAEQDLGTSGTGANTVRVAECSNYGPRWGCRTRTKSYILRNHKRLYLFQVEPTEAHRLLAEIGSLIGRAASEKGSPPLRQSDVDVIESLARIGEEYHAELPDPDGCGKALAFRRVCRLGFSCSLRYLGHYLGGEI
jgi:hypothetical protein